MQPLDIHTFPLSGQSLIEASAGTGKTYTIASLYSRLLLGHQTVRLGCDQILVVTFTNAATEELRGRIRERIRQMLGDVLRLLAACEQTSELPDSVLHSVDADTLRWLSELGLLDDVDTRQTRLRELSDWLNTNLSQMDNASIYTIHGFCQRMLKQFAFDSGVMFSAELLLDTQSYLRQACEDVWRNGNYRLAEQQVGYLLERYPTPEALQKEVRQWLSHPELVFLPQQNGGANAEQLDFVADWQALNRFFEQLSRQWQTMGAEDIAERIQSSDVDKRSFSKKNLPRWLAAAEQWLTGDFSLPVPAALENFGQRNLRAKTKVGKQVPEHSLFIGIDAFLDQERQLAVGLPQVWFERVRQRYIELLLRAGVMSPDDLLRLLDAALDSPQGRSLADQIRRLHPVGLIDEFQDTDPLQYRIFASIYASSYAAEPDGTEESVANSDATDSPVPAWGLAAIGDPKQAIYAFRGADIFTYIAARRALIAEADVKTKVEATDQPAPIFTLNTNWRSHTHLVNGVNRLFEQHPAPFVFDQDIPFVSVKAAGKHDQQAMRVGGKALAPLQLWLDENPISLPQARLEAATQCACQIRAVLSGAVSLDTDTVAARDMAVLVRSHQQAEMMRQALSAEGIGSVFLSRDSVLNSREAHDVLTWLSAVAEPTDERAVRRAMTTETQGLNAQQLDALLNDETAWEQRLEQMAGYHQLWQQQGVMAALMRWLEDDERAVQLRRCDDGERRLTNLLHLGEMLQQASRRLRGQLSLLRWFTEQVFDDGLTADEAQLRLETDANLVSIVTIHKSKGLEYPLVFLPFLWSDDFSPQSSREARYFDDERGNVVVNLEPDDAARQAQYRDNQAEAMRLLYVALTRPVQGCFVWLMNAGKYSKKLGWSARIQNTALGRLLQIDTLLKQRDGLPQDTSWCDALHQHWQDTGLSKQTQQLVLGPRPDWPVGALLSDEHTPEPGAVRYFQRRLNRHWRVSSFTGLSAHAAEHRPQAVVEETLDEAQTDSVLRADDDGQRLAAADTMPAEPVFVSSVEQTASRFPRGATPGTCLHAMMEHWDFSDREALETIVSQELQHFGLHPAEAVDMASGLASDTAPEWSESGVADWLQQVVQAELCDAHGQRFCLADIEAGQRLDEMEFCLPVQRRNVQRGGSLIEGADGEGLVGENPGDKMLRSESLNALLAGSGGPRSLSFEPLNGYLKGFIDLMFCWQGRYYLLDYKSNWLGDVSADYDADALTEAMTSHHYDLQAWIYTLALDQLLAQRLPDYDPEQHLGGAFYLFLRGMTGAGESGVERGEQSDLFAEPEAAHAMGVHYQPVAMEDLKRWKHTVLGEQAGELND